MLKLGFAGEKTENVIDKMHKIVKKLKSRNCQENIEAIKSDLTKLKESGDTNLRLGLSKIDAKANKNAEKFGEARKSMVGKANDQLESELMEFQGLNTYIQQYNEKLGCGRDSATKQTRVDKLLGISREQPGMEGCKIDYQSY